jgi:hypothetical protein
MPSSSSNFEDARPLVPTSTPNHPNATRILGFVAFPHNDKTLENLFVNLTSFIDPAGFSDTGLSTQRIETKVLATMMRE